MGCAGLWVVGGLPQSDRASRFPVLLPPPCWPGNAKSKEALPGTAAAQESVKGDATYRSPIPSFLVHFFLLPTAI